MARVLAQAVAGGFAALSTTFGFVYLVSLVFHSSWKQLHLAIPQRRFPSWIFHAAPVDRPVSVCVVPSAMASYAQDVLTLGVLPSSGFFAQSQFELLHNRHGLRS